MMKALIACWFCLIISPVLGQIAVSKPEWMAQMDSLLTVAAKFTGLRHYDEAIRTVEAARAVVLQAPGRRSGGYAWCQFNLGRVFYLSGQYEQAESCYLDAKTTWETAGKGREYIRCLNNLAVLYKDLGRYEASETLYRQALNNLEIILTKSDDDYPRILSNLAILYSRMGHFDAAGQLYREIIAIREIKPGKTSREYAASLNNLAILYYCMGRYEAADTLFQQAKNIREQTLGKNHQHYAGSLNNLALVYIELGRYGEAEAYLLEAKTIWAATLGINRPEYAECLHSLGLLYQKIGRYAEATTNYLEAIAIREKALGRMHPDYAASLSKLGLLYAEQGRYTQAAPLLQEANVITKSLLTNGTHFLSDRELDAYVQLFTTDLDYYYSFARQAAPEAPEIASSCYNNTLFYKGFLLYAGSQITNLATADIAATRLNELLRSCRRRLAREYGKPIAQRQDVDSLEVLANRTEKDLARRVAGFGEAIQQVPWETIRNVLNPGEAAIEFVHYRYYNPGRTDSVLYAALVIRHDDDHPQLIQLFEEKSLARILPPSNDPDAIDAFYKAPAGLVAYALIWQPLDPLLAGVKRIYCSPSGLLHRLNLSAVPVNARQIFADKYQLALLGSTRQLVTGAYRHFDSPEAEAVLFGGIYYDRDSSGFETNLMETDRRGSPDVEPAVAALFATTPGLPAPWIYLPATLTEVRHIAAILRANGFQCTLQTGASATETALKRIGRTDAPPAILHLATHGYFFPAPPENLKHTGLALDDQTLIFQASDQVMIRSGLIFAGANTTWTTGQAPASGEDGILTAYEISQLNLSNTGLVVLSACETGLGELAGYEGVYGLQRAFKIAGAHFLLMSLWQVNDAKTGELMRAFYHQYLDRKLPVPEAFSAAQAALRARYPDSPYVWAGFVLVE